MNAPDKVISDPTGRTSAIAQILLGDCIDRLKDLPEGSVHTCITSPPYFGLRSYLPDDHPDKAKEIGLEQTPEEFVAAMVAVFREVRRVLRDDGTLWLNLGDSYATTSSYNAPRTSGGEFGRVDGARQPRAPIPEGLKAKDLIGIPWRVAFALQADGWYLRQDIIWSKPNPMPESVTDRCTKAHEYLFLLSKSPRYYFDHESIQEPAIGGMAGNTKPTKAGRAFQSGAEEHRTAAGLHLWAERQRSRKNSFAREAKTTAGTHGQKPQFRPDRELVDYGGETRNKRSVWAITTKPYSGAHFATFPPDLIEPCVLAGCPEGGTVLDPFGGAGTTAGVALKHGRNAIVCELNAESITLIPDRVVDICRPDDAPARVVNEAQVELFGSEVAP